MKYLTIDPSQPAQAPTRDYAGPGGAAPDVASDFVAGLAGINSNGVFPDKLPVAKEVKVRLSTSRGGRGDDWVAGERNASLFFVGGATVILEWEGIRVMTDPNFLHAGDTVHLGPRVTGTRRTNPAVDLHELPNIDLVLLSHYHADHFDQHVENSLRRDLPIITTPHAKTSLTSKSEGENFTSVHDLGFWDSIYVNIGKGSGPRLIPRIKVTGMPGQHVRPGLFATMNYLTSAVPPTNGWMVELGYGTPQTGTSKGDFESGYRIYISGDTLMVDDLKSIPDHYRDKGIDLMLIHLGGMTIPSASMPLLTLTMDAKQGTQLVKLIRPDLTIPIHYDDYDVYLSPLSEFKAEMQRAGLSNKAVYLDRGDQYQFRVESSFSSS